MKPMRFIALVALLAGACAPARTTSPTPVPASTRETPPPADTAVARPTPTPTPTDPAAVPAEAPEDWQLLDERLDHVPGISAERAYTELLAGKQPKRTVVVAVIDGGVDTAHVDLKANLWTNPKEVAGNGKDDDANGYVDDVHGWDFIGGADGRDVRYDMLEVTRLYVACNTAAGSAGQGAELPPVDRSRCAAIEADYQKEKSEAEQTLQQIRMIEGAYGRALPLLREAAGVDSLTPAVVEQVQSQRQDVQQAKAMYMQLAANGITPAMLSEGKEQYESRVNYGLNPEFNPRDIVGDDFADVAQRVYGNADVMGPDAKHGTHVSGIIGAVRGNGVGVDGIAPAVKIMAVRTVPDGDERDKDVANAIRYAVDNGANVINMSFGKPYSPRKGAVDEAVKYADAHGVLMIHAAGNDAQDSDVTTSYPTPVYERGGSAANWIEVGASAWQGGEKLAAPFSNYGHTRVDVFAPGVDVLSTVPGGDYVRESGTSMAAPVVTGLAALIMAYYPELNAAQVKRAILESATKYSTEVVKPGTQGETVPFSSLSATGGIVNAYAALQLAARLASSTM